MKKTLFFLFALWLNSMAFAYEIEHEGLHYNVIATTDDTHKDVEVTYPEGYFYSGDIVIPSSFMKDGVQYTVTSIGDGSFWSCSELTSITIPNSVTSIGGGAFAHSGLTSITIPNSVTSIEGGAFANSGLTSVTIPNSVTFIAGGIFRGCSGLTSVTIPNSVTEMQGEVFLGCSGLTSVTLSENMTYIGERTFKGCTSLNTVIIPDGVTYICESAFNGCHSLTSINIPEGVINMGDSVFYNCNSLTSVSIPEGVTNIGNDAFFHCSALTSVSIPEGVTSIGYGAFYHCNSLTSVNIPEGVTWIGGYAFVGCSSLTSIKVDADNPIYDSRDNCNAIIETCSNTLIAGCQNTAIPNTVTSIGEYAFSYCSSLTSVTIPEGVTNIGYNAFWVCTSLTSVNIPNSVTSIGGCAFYQCMSLTSVTIPNSVTSIGDQAFRDCSSLTSVIIPNSVKNVGGYAFSGTPWYENMEDGMVYIGRTAYDYKGEMPAETAIVIKEGTTAIAGGAFQDCSGLTSITIPNSVTYIGDVAFRYCSGLTSITIPNNVTYIGYNAFGYCGNLTSVVSEIENLSAIGYYLPSPDGLPATCQLTVPYGTKEAYAARGWTEEVFQGGVVEAPYNPGTDNYLEISDAEVLKGRSVSIPVSMRNSEPITAMQFEVALPENVTLAECRLTDRAGTDHAASFRQKSNGNYQITVFSMSNENMKGSEGAVLELVVETSEESAADHHAIILKNIELTTEDVVAIRPYDVYATLIVSDMKVADANGDGKISITDAVAIAGYLLENPPRSFVQLAADVNGDGSITITDAVAVIDMILNDEASAKARKTAADMLDPQ